MGIITLTESDCKDCHRCIRNCSLKAIGNKGGQSEVVEDKCIYCGECIEVCPQNAKEVSNQLTELKKILEGEELIASLAPSFVAAFDCQPNQLVAALKELGFSAVEETAKGAEVITKHYNQLLTKRNKPLISACCPAVVNLIERHYPELIPYLAPSISPMVAHGKMIKEKYTDAKVVFIGPCIAKLDEVSWDSSKEAIDLAITFDQLQELLIQSQIDYKNLEPVKRNNSISSWATAFPVEGGVLKSAELNTDFNSDILSVSGLDECINTFQDLLATEISPRFIEAMVCNGGCINGPGLSSELGVNARREKIVNYTQNIVKQKKNQHRLDSNLKRSYTNKKAEIDLPTENQIKLILSQIGKFSPEDELDCGGCGYNSCREKAIAVYQGLAENRMCIPYMKGKLESLADIIVETSPNAIIVVDKDMVIQKFNPQANKLFNRRDELAIGNKLHRYLDPQDFINVADSKKCISRKKVEYKQYDVIVEEAIFPLPEYDLIVGILTDVTEQEKHKEKVAKMKETTLEKANAVINKQMKVAQEIAGLLGESTSETKAILHEVRELMREER
ncbi:iron only hydrogenase large subunit [Halobacteroides halobius DSM 5150]|uniref:Iron only hydrogenase large subunit n=1 Tax=Halobacteroides halobius (strain ATCC 35273 / DSM 5150 / MD-1) TaxID=748449 RepID=L0K7F9_HALHC|nr:[Fe-Fe] hydrogenase large subunit C-terminal domain-containing protein [Halobacteroides halobius]AGB40058.1 iron only hydrogenase large subunit [Halobacteroides halobius DSM 5150]